MTTKQREDVRAGLLALGFERATSEYPDRADFYDRGNGAYTEMWKHKIDRTAIELRWDLKTPV